MLMDLPPPERRGGRGGRPHGLSGCHPNVASPSPTTPVTVGIMYAKIPAAAGKGWGWGARLSPSYLRGRHPHADHPTRRLAAKRKSRSPARPLPPAPNPAKAAPDLCLAACLEEGGGEGSSEVVPHRPPLLTPCQCTTTTTSSDRHCRGGT
jgi:hypothetical protein